MKYIAFSLFLLSSFSYAEDYIGQITPPTPEGVQKLAGALIKYEIKEKAWSVSIVKIKNINHLWLSSFEKRKGKKAYFKIRNQVAISKLDKNERIYLALCKNIETNEKEITGIGIGSLDIEWHKNISKAWRANIKTGKLESISTFNITCYNEGYGV